MNTVIKLFEKAALVTLADSAKAYLRQKVATPAPRAVSQRELATVGS